MPTNEAHSGHPVRQEAILGQKLHPRLAQKIMEMVSSGITDMTEIRRTLKFYVKQFLSREIGQKPHPHDKAFYPQDIMNHLT